MIRPRRTVFMDRVQEWYRNVIDEHYDAARARVREILAETEADGNGCMLTETDTPKKVRFQGGQDRAYRFVYCIMQRLAPTRDQVVRHRCHNRRCVNPAHLEIGDRRDNLMDERQRRAAGIDYRFI